MLSKVYSAVFFACADDGIGKFDRSMLSQQELMELFIFGLNKPGKVCGNRDELADVCEWKGITCNHDGEVEEFHWVFKQDTGTLGFEFLPCSMKTLRMFMNALSGTIQLNYLPGMMEAVFLNDNQLNGSLDLDRLPAAVRSLFLNSNEFTGKVSLENLPKCLKQLKLSQNQLSANPTKDTSPWWVGPVPQFWGKPRTFLNPSSCFCHGADPIDGHRKVVGQDQYPALGEVRETAKLLPRGESPWWRDERRHLLTLCLYSIRGMRLAHTNNAKSREHAHTCRKARAILKLRYKNKNKKSAQWHNMFNIPSASLTISLSRKKQL